MIENGSEAVKSFLVRRRAIGHYLLDLPQDEQQPAFSASLACSADIPLLDDPTQPLYRDADGFGIRERQIRAQKLPACPEALVR
jgi:hypothetical protein